MFRGQVNVSEWGYYLEFLHTGFVAIFFYAISFSLAPTNGIDAVAGLIVRIYTLWIERRAVFLQERAVTSIAEAIEPTTATEQHVLFEAARLLSHSTRADRVRCRLQMQPAFRDARLHPTLRARRCGNCMNFSTVLWRLP